MKTRNMLLASLVFCLTFLATRTTSMAGYIVGWGANDYGQTTAPAGNNFVAIAAGMSHSLALKSDGLLVAWGENSSGQTSVPAENDFLVIAAGHVHNLAIKSDGSLVGWGSDGWGQTTVPAGNNFMAIAAGGYHSLAIQVPEPTAWTLLVLGAISCLAAPSRRRRRDG